MTEEDAGRYLIAVGGAAIAGSVLFALGSVFQTWTSTNAIFRPGEAFRLSLAYSLLLSSPIVAVALPLFGRAGRYLILRYSLPPAPFALLIGAIGGLVTAIPVALMLNFEPVLLFGLSIGLCWGVPSALLGLFVWPRLSSGDHYG